MNASIPFGAAMNKALTIKTGQTHVQQFMPELLDLIDQGKIDPSFVITHRLPLAHAAENLMGKLRDGMPVTADAVTLVLSTIDRIKVILDEIEAHQTEPEGGDADLIDHLSRMARDSPLGSQGPNLRATSHGTTASKDLAQPGTSLTKSPGRLTECFLS